MKDRLVNNSTKPVTITVLKIIALYVSFSLILSRAWVGEDAFISFRYVDNFIGGHGLVYNIGERVEGFTHPLWIFVLSVIRIFGFELRPTAIFLGITLTLISLGLLLFLDSGKNNFLPLGVFFLISNSAFRDFATSGFETSLTILLVVILSLVIKKHGLFSKPFMVGALCSLLALNRPETILVLFYVSINYVLSLMVKLVTAHTRDILPTLKNFLRFLLPACLTILPYQIFRMGYYADILPNTFYAKKGGSFYITQGINYLKDFSLSYNFHWVILILLILLFIEIKFFWNKNIFVRKLHLILMSLGLALYVLYTGGDYMHGRFLIASLVFLMVAFNNILEIVPFVKNRNLTIQASLLILILYINIQQIPISYSLEKQIKGVKDERHHFNPDPPKTWEDLVKPITSEFGWRERGAYYKDVAEALQIPVTVNMPNIGFFGYAAGKNVKVVGIHLIDFYLSKFPIEKRGTIAHEGENQYVYNLYRKPTFGYTPYLQWNIPAHAKYEKSEFTFIIAGDSNDSYPPVDDLSDPHFLEKFSKLTNSDIKSTIDNAQRKYLKSLDQETINKNFLDTLEYLGFLKRYWLPYAQKEDQEMFNNINNKFFSNEFLATKYDLFDFKIKPEADEFLGHTIGGLTLKKFIDNFMFAAKSPFYKHWYSKPQVLDGTKYKGNLFNTENIEFNVKSNSYNTSDISGSGTIKIAAGKDLKKMSKSFLKINFIINSPNANLTVIVPNENQNKITYGWSKSDTDTTKIKEAIIDVTKTIWAEKEIVIQLNNIDSKSDIEVKSVELL